MIALRVGGNGQFTAGNVTALLGNLDAVSGGTGGLLAGSSIGFDTSAAAGGTFTIAGDLTNSSGSGGGAIGLVELGSGSLVLSGTNTCSGGTIVEAGTLVVTTPAALPPDSNLTVGSEATLIFAPLTSASSTAAPEPSALALLGAGGLGLLGYAWPRRKLRV